MSHFLTVLCLIGLWLPANALNKDFHISTLNTETWVTLKFTPTVSRFADVLFIIDDSGSMSVHQKNLATNIQAITQALSSYVSLNAAVISTSTSNSNTGVFIGGIHKSSEPQFISTLKQSLMVGTNGSYEEKPFETLFLALSEPLISTTNKGFLRDDADLYLVFLTDTQDQSSIDENQIYSLLKNLKPTQAISSIAGMVTDTKTCKGETAELEVGPPKIQNLVNLTGGSVFSLCGDFVQNLTDSIKTTVVTEKSLLLPTVNNKKILFSTLSLEIANQIIPAGDVVTGWYFNSIQSTVYFTDPFLLWASDKGPMTINYRID
jgi:hypothetical protein